MKALTEISDRLVARFVPQATAHADECLYETLCQASDCNSEPWGHNRLRRLVCANAGAGRWTNYGCC